MPLVGWVLVIMAAFSVIGVLFMVLREHPEHEEAYTPPQPGTATEPQKAEEAGE